MVPPTLEQIDELLRRRLNGVKVELKEEIVSAIEEKIENAKMEIIEVVDKHKADKQNVEHLEKRVTSLEEQIKQN